MRKISFCEIWNLFSRAPIRNRPWGHHRQQITSTALKKCKKERDIPQTILGQDFCPLITQFPDGFHLKFFTVAISNVHFIGSYKDICDGMFRLLFLIPLLSQVGVNESQHFRKLAQKQNITWLIINMGCWLTSVRSSFLKQKAKTVIFYLRRS